MIAAQAFEYSAFGDLLSASTPETRYLYTGQQYDSATDLYSLRARYYDAGVGRFMSRDTWAYDFANPVELNRYVYAMGNPVRWADPSGYMATSEYGLKTRLRMKANSGLRDLTISITEGAMYGFIGRGIGILLKRVYEAALDLRSEDEILLGFEAELLQLPGLIYSILFGARQGFINALGEKLFTKWHLATTKYIHVAKIKWANRLAIIHFTTAFTNSVWNTWANANANYGNKFEMEQVGREIMASVFNGLVNATSAYDLYYNISLRGNARIMYQSAVETLIFALPNVLEARERALTGQ